MVAGLLQNRRGSSIGNSPSRFEGVRMRTGHRGVKLVLFLVLSLVAASALAQGTSSTISGTVRDSSGAVVPGATIDVANAETGRVRSITTDATGRYRVTGLEAGHYSVKASLEGFKTTTVDRVNVPIASERVVDVTTELGQLAENVTVNGGVPLIQTTSAELSGLVNDKEIRELPLNGRSYESLAYLQPGVAQFTSASSNTTSIIANGAGSKMSVSGTPTDFSSFLLDGTDIHDHAGFTPGSVARTNLGVDAIREFRVLTQNYSAEYGRTAGGVVSAVTRSGTNRFSGSAFEFFRNNRLDSPTYFDANGTLPFTRNQFGGAFGGPIARDRTFFFFNYEGLRQNLSQTLPRTVPNASARAGQIPGKPPITVSPLIQPYLALVPLPNGRDFGDGTGEYLWAADTRTHEDFETIRIDHQFTPGQSIFGRVTMDRAKSTLPNTGPGFMTGLTSKSSFNTLEHKAILNARMVNIARMAFNRTDPLLEDLPSASETGLGFVSGRTWSIISNSNAFSDIGHLNSAPQEFVQNIWQFSDDFDIQRGTHSIRLGFNFERQQNNNFTQTGQAQFQFTDLTSLLTAKPTRFSALTLDSGTLSQFRQSFVGYYVQDDWRATNALTLNLGLRHEFVTIPTEVGGHQANIRDIVHDTAPTFGAVFTKNPSLKNIAPRLGAAWTPWGDTRPVIRAGAGIYYNEIMGRMYYNYARSGFLQTAQINKPAFPDPRLDSVASGNVSYSIWDPQPKTPTVYQYNVTVEQQLPSSTVATVSYVGSQGRHWVRDRSPNTRIPEVQPDGSLTYPAGGPRINPAFGNLRQLVTDATAQYNGLQVQVTRRDAQRYAWQVSYTFSKAMSSATAWGNALTQNTPAISLDPNDAHADWSLSPFDIRHKLAVNATVHLPGDSLTGPAAWFARGWEASGILTAYSGLPLTVQLGTNRSNDGNSDAPDRPDLKPGASANPVIGSVDQWYDPTAFVFPAAGRYGNVGRNTIIGPGLFTLDASFVKSFNPRQAHALTLRIECFNLTNRANFGLPNPIAFQADGTYSASAGVIQTLTTPARQIQLGLRYSF